MGLIEVQIDGVQALRERMNTLVSRVKDPTELWDGVIKDFEEGEKRNFEHEGTNFGKQWTPLTDRYAAWKDMHYPGRPLMVLTGALKDALTTDAPGAIRSKEPEFVLLGSSVSVSNKSGKQWNLGAIWQNHGERPRETLWADGDTVQAWKDRTEEYLRMAMGGGSGGH